MRRNMVQKTYGLCCPMLSLRRVSCSSSPTFRSDMITVRRQSPVPSCPPRRDDALRGRQRRTHTGTHRGRALGGRPARAGECRSARRNRTTEIRGAPLCKDQGQAVTPARAMAAIGVTRARRGMAVACTVSYALQNRRRPYGPAKPWRFRDASRDCSTRWLAPEGARNLRVKAQRVSARDAEFAVPSLRWPARDAARARATRRRGGYGRAGQSRRSPHPAPRAGTARLSPTTTTV